MFKAALYLSIGLLLHVIFVGAHIDPTNAWSWLWLVAWPVPMLVVGVLAAVIVAVLNSWIDYIKGAMR